MLDVSEILVLVGAGSIYIFYAIGSLCKFLYRTRYKCSIHTAAERLFSGWEKNQMNMILVAVATYQLLGPGVLNQMLGDDFLQAIMYIVSRALGFVVCVIYWNFLARIGMKTICCLCSSIKPDFWLVSPLEIAYDIVGLLRFVQFSATGGMSVVLAGCPLLWLFNISGRLILFRRTIPYMFRSSPFKLLPDACYSSLSPTKFFYNLCEILTIQPIYNMYLAIGNRKRANIAMGIALILFLIDTAMYTCVTNGMQHYSKIYGINLHQVIHHMYGTELSRSGIFYSTSIPKRVVYISYEHFILLLGTHVTYIIAIFILHTQSICTNIYLHGLPLWMRRGLISDGHDLQIAYSCLYLVISYLFALSLMRSSSSSMTSEAMLHSPKVAGSMITPVAVLILLGPLLSDVWTIPAAMTIAISVIFSVVFAYQDPERLWENCLTPWYETIDFVFALLCCIIFSIFFRTREQCQPELFFRRRLQIRKPMVQGFVMKLADKSIFLATTKALISASKVASQSGRRRIIDS
ncbi:unnamed protein product [Calicophoron daubneyi]|uniref:Uncharacterized protein n=1 Tax=Calicophoron daubneyi TaxID=300641 RepID=A0AAV2TQP4_CALDB